MTKQMRKWIERATIATGLVGAALVFSGRVGAGVALIVIALMGVGVVIADGGGCDD